MRRGINFKVCCVTTIMNPLAMLRGKMWLTLRILVLSSFSLISHLGPTHYIHYSYNVTESSPVLVSVQV